MIRHLSLEHRFVRNVPRELESGILYISMDYATAVHSCCCGCGERVVTPFTPTDWRMTFDGESVSLHPSVGNWNQKCQSHYVVQRGRVLEAAPWSQSKIEAERLRDKAAKAAHYGSETKVCPDPEHFSSESNPSATPMHRIWSWLKSWLGL
ncbi:hypothetical protein OX90_11910 [Pseudomonas coronafaciens pv. porri]|uniref:Uncharacterized protein n=2 Tax=Pseudomonas TaxID=286 RepID=A0ABR5JP94_9PSED|nr:hypothetical protein OX90_11910 [Pseudomonas coronafaciens pv. porri]